MIIQKPKRCSPSLINLNGELDVFLEQGGEEYETKQSYGCTLKYPILRKKTKFATEEERNEYNIEYEHLSKLKEQQRILHNREYKRLWRLKQKEKLKLKEQEKKLRLREQIEKGYNNIIPLSPNIKIDFIQLAEDLKPFDIECLVENVVNTIHSS